MYNTVRVRTYTTEPQLAKQEASKAFLFPPNPANLAGSQMSPPLYSAILFGPPGKKIQKVISIFHFSFFSLLFLTNIFTIPLIQFFKARQRQLSVHLLHRTSDGIF